MGFDRQLNAQWGFIRLAAAGTTIIFPVTYKKNYTVQLTDGGNGCFSWGVSIVNLTGFNAYAREVHNGNPVDASGFYFSIGA